MPLTKRMRRDACVFVLQTLFAGGVVWLTGIGADAQPRGKAVYDAHCVECHGAGGKGDGPSAAYLTPRPRDFTTGKYKIRSTESGTPPGDEDLIGSVRRGLYGTAMPGWDRLLSDVEIGDVVQYVKSLSPQFAAQPPKPIAIAIGLPSSPSSIARGQQAYDKLQCGKCHGTDGRGTGAVATTFEDDWRMPLRAADLTEPWTFHGGATSRDIYLRFRAGMTGTPMPSFADAASEAEMWDLANYVVSLGRKPIWSMDAAEVQQFYAQQDAKAKADPVKRGEQLVDTLGCVICHSPVDREKRMLPGMRLAGGMLIRIGPFGDYPTGNLTSDKATGLGEWTNDEIKRVITKGVLRDGSRLLPFPMDYGSFSTLTSDDLEAIVAYLRTVPAVSNKVPAPSRPFLPVYLWGKFKMLILGDDPPMVFFAGNAGSKGAPR
jgi:cbb3-type cytochrome c oxidase subunit III